MPVSRFIFKTRSSLADCFLSDLEIFLNFFKPFFQMFLILKLFIRHLLVRKGFEVGISLFYKNSTLN
jgi:hypothetical protein